MKILKGNYGECRFCDNMNPEYGLPSLEEKSWDLCLTDPPYGGGKKKKKRINYEDFFIGLDWFTECLKFDNFVFTSGQISLFKYPPPNLLIAWYKPANTGHNCVGGMCNWEPILYYGKKRIPIDVIKTPPNFKDPTKYHSTPKPFILWNKLVKLIKPLSVLDPFLGSGTTAEVCESLGIPWLGYEIMEEYAPDIEKRIARGIKKKQQQSLETFLERDAD